MGNSFNIVSIISEASILDVMEEMHIFSLGFMQPVVYYDRFGFLVFKAMQLQMHTHAQPGMLGTIQVQMHRQVQPGMLGTVPL